MEIQLVVFKIQNFKFSIIWEKRGFLPKFKPPYLLNYWVDFDKIGVALKEIVHRSHFCNKMLLLRGMTLPLTLQFVRHITNYFLNMEIKIEVYFYNVKSLGEVYLWFSHNLHSKLNIF